MGAAEDGDELNAIPFFETLHHFSAPAEDLPADISPTHPHRLWSPSVSTGQTLAASVHTAGRQAV
jgi:hypothetical protein